MRPCKNPRQSYVAETHHRSSLRDAQNLGEYNVLLLFKATVIETVNGQSYYIPRSKKLGCKQLNDGNNDSS